MEQEEAFAGYAEQIIFVVRSKEALETPTLSKALAKLKNIQIYYDDFSEIINTLGRRMYVDPDKLPLIIVTNGSLNGIYATSGYNVGTGDMGHRIELGEIEAAMDKVPEIVRSCCIFDTVKSKIVAFYEGDIERRPLAKALGQYVPAFMVPNVFRQVESMPLTKNGKIDRKALTAMYQEEKK